MKFSLLLLATVALKAINASSGNQVERIFIKGELHKDSLINVYIEYGSQHIEGDVALSYGSCQDLSSADLIALFHVSDKHKPEKFAWYVPTDAESGCFSATNTAGRVVAQSEPYTFTEKLSKRGHPKLSDIYFNAIDYHRNNKASRHSEASSKDKRIGIIGAGMSGLFSGYLLDQAGFHNYEILEASDRVGGRVRTVYFDDSETAYQEMGAMRFPLEFEYKGRTLPVEDQLILFQLSDELNALNDESHRIEFIKWYTGRSNNLYYMNGFRLPDGRIPTLAEVRANTSLAATGPDVSKLKKEVKSVISEFMNEDWYKLIGTDIHAAYAKAIEEGYEDWSEMDWLHNKYNVSLNATLYYLGSDGSYRRDIWEDVSLTFTFEEPTSWRTVQGGAERIPRAFKPLLGDKIVYGKRVSKLDYKDDKVSVQWKDSPFDRQYQSREYDNVVVAVPFGVVRTWKLPQLDFLLNEAIHKLRYSHACKAALSFSKRFWEHLDRPIQGGCDQTDLFSGQICYPVNNFGSNGTGVVLASYVEDDLGFHASSMTEERYVGRVLEDFTELHGDLVDKYYTGNYSSHCWTLDPFASGSWAMPLPGQSKLYLPSFSKIDHGLVFVGDHTDVKNGWVSTALVSAIRGVVMILVENGHIDEAKTIIEKYNVTWLRI